MMAAIPVPKSVIIVGGSLSGLMHALTLLSLKPTPKVRILERSPTALLHNQGAGVVAGNETQEFFAEYVNPGREIAVTSHLRHYLKHNGDIFPDSTEHKQQRMTSWDLLYHLLRWRVENMETEYVKGLEQDDRPRAEYSNGCTVTKVEEADDQVKITWNEKDKGQQSEVADLVIAADGGSSSIRRQLAPDVQRQYAGYLGWRGTVPEDELSQKATAAFSEKFTFYHSKGIQALAYLIPGKNGTTKPGQRLLNWLWYSNYEDGSPELEETMTDSDGNRHGITLPVGKVQDKIWEKQKQHADKVLPPQFAEVVSKTKEPFIQAITDSFTPQNSYLNGKVLLVGDALAGFRPHTAASTSQAAHDAMQLGKWLRGESTKEQYDQEVMDYAKRTQEHGVKIGQRSQFGTHPYAD